MLTLFAAHISKWSCDTVASWLEQLKSQNNLNVDVTNVALEGRLFVQTMTEEKLEKLSDKKSAMVIYAAMVSD